LTVTSGNGGQLVFNPSGGSCTMGAVNFTAAGSGGSSSGETSAPQPVIQQFGKPAFVTCDAAAPASLNWTGVPSGGWANSWAQGVNGGRGGAVCTRALIHSIALGAWTTT
jgi:hypothetical protein